jgi:hypothetical protein
MNTGSTFLRKMPYILQVSYLNSNDTSLPKNVTMLSLSLLISGCKKYCLCLGLFDNVLSIPLVYLIIICMDYIALNDKMFTNIGMHMEGYGNNLIYSTNKEYAER